jgi:hypothetical protein
LPRPCGREKEERREREGGGALLGFAQREKRGRV